MAKENEQLQAIIKTYVGKQSEATAAFQADAITMASNGYFPTSQSWAEGTYGCGAFFAALILCFLLIGFLIFVYMLIVKPAGTLSVTYELRMQTPTEEKSLSALEKTCPKCAEQVKAAALVCRYCGYEFSTAPT